MTETPTVDSGGTTIPVSRWVAKWAARRGIGAIGTVGAMVARRPATRVLTYHRILDHHHDPFAVSPSAFDEQMARLAASGRLIDLDGLEDHLAGTDAVAATGPGPRDGLLVTIDDIETSVIEYGLTSLVAHGVPAIAFPIAGMVDRPGFATSSQLRELVDAGVEIGSHTITHRRMGRLDPQVALMELVDSRAILEDIIGRPVRALAYPFGTKGAIAPWLGPLAAEAGYSVAFSSLHGPVTADVDPMFVPRVKVEGGDSPALFGRLIDGALDPWRVVDEGLGFLQRPPSGAEGHAPAPVGNR